MTKSNILVVTLFLALAGQQTAAASEEMNQPVAATKMARADGWARELDLRYWQTATFHPDLNHIIDSLGSAHGAEQVSVLHDAAELYMTHMLLLEASSVLEGLIPETPSQIRRQRALSDAAQLLAGNPAQDFVTSPLFDLAREDRAFWASLQAIASADVALLEANFEDSFTGLGRQSRAVLRAMLPVFVEAAIETRNDDYADAGLRLLQELPDLDASSTGYFLRGLAEDRRGNQSSAIEAYFAASEGWDQYAVRARLSVADMALRDGGRGALLAAQSTLSAGAESWRGNRYELELLKRLARINSDIENDVEALMTLGKILRRFPHTPEAKIALKQAQDLLAKLYAQGKAGEFSLAAWMDVHLRLIPLYRYTLGFSKQTEHFGDYILELGATDLAIEEYRRAVRLMQENGVADPDESIDDYFRLNMKMATAQIRAGLLDEARSTLEGMAVPDHRAHQDDHALLKSKVLADLGDRSALLDTFVAVPTFEHLRRQGLAFAQEGKWTRSNDVFLQLWEKHPQEFSVQDATRLLIAANRSNDAETTDRVARAFPDLTTSKPLIDLAESLNAEPPGILPLKAESAAKRLKSLESAFESIKKTSISP